VSLFGTQYDFPFFRNVMSPMIRKIFNLKCPVRKAYSREFDIHSPKIHISSQAHHTWLEYVGFPLNGDRPSFDFRTDALKKAFFAGIISSMGNIDPTQRSLKIPDTNQAVLQYIDDVAGDLGYTSSGVRPSFRGLVFTREETRRMAADNIGFDIDYNGSNVTPAGLYANPRDLAKLHKILEAGNGNGGK
jgi:hypothetical protein